MSELPNTVATDTQAEIALHVRAKEYELRIGSRLIAGLTCAAMAAYLAFARNFSGLGEYSEAWIAGLGFLAGACFLGERLVFTLLGALIATQLLPVQCP